MIMLSQYHLSFTCMVLNFFCMDTTFLCKISMCSQQSSNSKICPRIIPHHFIRVMSSYENSNQTKMEKHIETCYYLITVSHKILNYHTSWWYLCEQVKKNQWRKRERNAPSSVKLGSIFACMRRVFITSFWFIYSWRQRSIRFCTWRRT